MFVGGDGATEPILRMPCRQCVRSGAQRGPAGPSVLETSVGESDGVCGVQESLRECEAQLAAALQSISDSARPIALVCESSCGHLRHVRASCGCTALSVVI